MPHSQLRTLIFVSALILLALAAVACSSESETQDSVGSTTGNYATCEGFITAKQMEAETGQSALTERVRVFDIASIPGLAESGATANCLIEVFRTVDGDDQPAPGDSLTLSIVQFETSDLALSLFNSTLASAIITAEQVGDLAEIQQEVVGSDSYLMDVKSGGIGAIVVYVFDSTFISMSSTADAEGNALLDGQELVNVAEGVQSRLP
ncbi:MAG: hypothetical protein H8D69_01750 [Chloroflexi bacterium]|nr:hypothetical protein [Chloroflexota bacterium]